ncbi:MAG: SDR family NAD(P)-dependent oxidoreductase, partial [Xanthomonadales bacterium]|nr:SDR family NAD(P)-dependent oxidoreductase [Xanthomonadales bacterium]
MTAQFKDKVALVTGASRGIGAEIADELARRGALVVGTATSQQGAEAIEARLRGFGPDHLGRALDVNDTDGVAGLLGELTAGP